MNIEKLMSENAAKKPASRRASNVTANVDFSKLIRMGFNEHPYGMSPKALEIMKAETEKSNFYGDFGKGALKKAIADFYGLDFANVAASAGSSPLIETIGCAFLNPGDEVLMCPTFAAFIDMAQIRQAVPVVVPLNEDKTYDLDGLYNAITKKTKIIVVCNPNNPTGTVVDSEELKEFIHKVPKDIIIVVDEAYIELSSNPDVKSMVSEISDDTNVVVARTFSKLYGLAGVRLGYAMCNKEMHAILQKCTSVFTGSRVALAGAMAALDVEEYIKKTKAAMLEGRKYLTDEFTKMGFYVYPSETNFLYVNTGYNAAEFAEECKKYGLIIRGNFEYSRITVGRMDQNEKMVGIIKKIIESGELKKI